MDTVEHLCCRAESAWLHDNTVLNKAQLSVDCCVISEHGDICVREFVERSERFADNRVIICDAVSRVDIQRVVCVDV